MPKRLRAKGGKPPEQVDSKVSSDQLDKAHRLIATIDKYATFADPGDIHDLSLARGKLSEAANEAVRHGLNGTALMHAIHEAFCLLSAKALEESSKS